MSELHLRQWGGEKCHYGVIPVYLPLLLLPLWGGGASVWAGKWWLRRFPWDSSCVTGASPAGSLISAEKPGAEVRAFTMPAISETELGELQNFRKLSRFAS